MDDRWESEISEYGALNITGFRIVDTERRYVREFLDGWKRLDPSTSIGAGKESITVCVQNAYFKNVYFCYTIYYSVCLLEYHRCFLLYRSFRAWFVFFIQRTFSDFTLNYISGNSILNLVFSFFFVIIDSMWKKPCVVQLPMGIHHHLSGVT